VNTNNPIKIFSHWDSSDCSWKSNYEVENFWPGQAGSAWKTTNFVTKIQMAWLRNQHNYPVDIIDYNNSDNHDHGYYLIFYGSSTQILDHYGLAFLTPDIITKCNQGTLKLLIAFVHETFDSGISTRQWYNDFCNKLNLLGMVKSNSVVILTGTKFFNRLVSDHRCEFIYYPWFELDLQTSFKISNKVCPDIDLDRKNKYYINLNRAIRPHRFIMVMYLKYRNVLNCGNVSWQNPTCLSWQEILSNFGFHQKGVSGMGRLGQLDKFDVNGTSFLNFISTVNVLDSMQLDDLSQEHLMNGAHHGPSWCGAEEYYTTSYIDLVSETHSELYGDAFLTEKTFKPLAYGLPFIFNSGRNHLGLVKQLGYQSFPELFNEQYDAMPTTLEKLGMIGEEIVQFCENPNKIDLIKNSPEILEKLKFNQNLFWNRNHPQELGKLLYDAWHRSCA
jgi:hypothetical protein